MNTFNKRITLGLLQGCLVAVPLFVLSAGSATAAEPVACHAAKSSLDARLASKADEGPTALRRFVSRTVTIYGLDVPTANARIERVRTAREQCIAAVEAS